MSATAKFYTGLTVALILVIGLSFAAGYRSGYHAAARVAHVPHYVRAAATP